MAMPFLVESLFIYKLVTKDIMISASTISPIYNTHSLMCLKSCVNTYTAPPSAPSNVMIMNESHVENFSIILSWDPPLDDVLVDSYRILTNTTTHPLSTTNYTVVLEGKYNIPQQITLSAINCAGSSEEVTKEVLVGKYL